VRICLRAVLDTKKKTLIIEEKNLIKNMDKDQKQKEVALMYFAFFYSLHFWEVLDILLT
jgi:hypothetical protein